ncbi:MAG: ABC transporter permease [Pelosinus sp.]|nr:ABC transporter permease [Pelosinus sp.]
MDVLREGIRAAAQLLSAGDPEIIEVLLLTFKVSGAATLISVLLGVPLGLYLALKEFYGKQFIKGIVNFGMGLPPVVVGLFVSLLLWRYGPWGELALMYTPTAMVMAQTLIALPIVTGLSFAAIVSVNPRLRLQLYSLGATSRQVNWMLIKEARLGLIAAVIAGFGRVVSEVGAAMMVGGNIKGQTRVLTTATVMEVGKGNYDTALALSFILLVAAYSVVVVLTWLQHSGKREIL